MPAIMPMRIIFMVDSSFLLTGLLTLPVWHVDAVSGGRSPSHGFSVTHFAGLEELVRCSAA